MRSDYAIGWKLAEISNLTLNEIAERFLDHEDAADALRDEIAGLHDQIADLRDELANALAEAPQ